VKEDSNIDVSEKKTQESKEETVNYIQNLQLVDKSDESVVELKQPLKLHEQLNAIASSTTTSFVDQQLTASSLDEFAQQINTIVQVQNEQANQQLLISQVHLEQILNQISQNQETAQKWVSVLRESLESAVREFGNIAAFVVVDLQKVMKSSFMLADISVQSVPASIQQQVNAPKQESQTHPVELKLGPTSLAADTHIPDKSTQIAELSSNVPSSVEVGVEEQLSLREQQAKIDTIEEEKRSESVDKKLQPSSDEILTYQHEIGVHSNDQTSASTLIGQTRQLEEHLNIQATEKSIINVDRQLNASTINEFIQQIEKLAVNEQAKQVFIISNTHLETTLKNLQG
jgi:hypothetical protein